MSAVLQYVLYLAILIALAVPLGGYIKRVMDGEKTFLSPVLGPCEKGVYRPLHIDENEEMNWKQYAASVLIFSGIGLGFLWVLQMVQQVLPANPQHLGGGKWDLAFNTAASFVTNTNWQAYSGESTLSYLSQFLGLTVQNFVSAATGIAVLFALIRGFCRVRTTGLGSFWVDMTRILIHILLPLNLVIALMLVGGGVIQNLKPGQTVPLVEPVAVSADGEVLEDAVIEGDTVTVDGAVVPDAQIVTKEFVPMGPAASQVAIKQTGTNGGGFISAHGTTSPVRTATPEAGSSLIPCSIFRCSTGPARRPKIPALRALPSATPTRCLPTSSVLTAACATSWSLTPQPAPLCGTTAGRVTRRGPVGHAARPGHCTAL